MMRREEQEIRRIHDARDELVFRNNSSIETSIFTDNERKVDTDVEISLMWHNHRQRERERERGTRSIDGKRRKRR
jgi:hypothetical protein